MYILFLFWNSSFYFFYLWCLTVEYFALHITCDISKTARQETQNKQTKPHKKQNKTAISRLTKQQILLSWSNFLLLQSKMSKMDEISSHTQSKSSRRKA